MAWQAWPAPNTPLLHFTQAPERQEHVSESGGRRCKPSHKKANEQNERPIPPRNQPITKSRGLLLLDLSLSLSPSASQPQETVTGLPFSSPRPPRCPSHWHDIQKISALSACFSAQSFQRLPLRIRRRPKRCTVILIRQARRAGNFNIISFSSPREPIGSTILAFCKSYQAPSPRSVRPQSQCSSLPLPSKQAPGDPCA